MELTYTPITNRRQYAEGSRFNSTSVDPGLPTKRKKFETGELRPILVTRKTLQQNMYNETLRLGRSLKKAEEEIGTADMHVTALHHQYREARFMELANVNI